MANEAVNTKFDTHICLVSDQATPNLTPILSEEWRPKKVVLLASDSKLRQAEWLKKAIDEQPFKIDCEIKENIEAYNIDKIQEQFLDLVIANQDESNINHLAFNITGGTKTMAIAAQIICEASHIPFFYVNDQTNEIQLKWNQPSGINTPKPFVPTVPKIKFRIKDYLNAHGFSSQPKRTVKNYKADSTETKELFEKLISSIQNNSNTIGIVNALAANVDWKLTATIDERHINNQRLLDILDAFKKAGKLRITDNKVTFIDDECRKFVGGAWLEDYVFNIVKKLRDKKEIQDCAESIEICSSKGVKNELDVAFLAKNRFFVIECKTMNYEVNDVNEDLYKVFSNTQRTGLKTTGMFVSYRRLKAPAKERAKDYHITPVDVDLIKDLENQILKWIYPERYKKEKTE